MERERIEGNEWKGTNGKERMETKEHLKKRRTPTGIPRFQRYIYNYSHFMPIWPFQFRNQLRSSNKRPYKPLLSASRLLTEPATHSGLL